MEISSKTEELLREAWAQLPKECRSEPATYDQIAAIEREIGEMPSAFRWFLQTFGGGVVGAEWIDDVSELSVSHAKFNKEREHWEMRDCFLIA